MSGRIYYYQQSMRGNLRLSPATKLCINNSFYDLLVKTRPMIQDIADGIARGDGLDDSVSRVAERRRETADYFHLETPLRENFRLRDEFLFAQPSVSELTITNGNRQYSLDLKRYGAEQLLDLADFLRCISAGDATAASVPERYARITRRLQEVSCLVEATEDNPPVRRETGIYRFQHASLFYRSSNTGILVDPHLHSSYRPAGVTNDIPRSFLSGNVDAILISHSHEDHWFLSALLTFPRDTLIIVPEVPRPTVVCEDMRATLRAFGFTRILTPPWYSEVTVGDFRISILPYYGEQPLLNEAPQHPAIRNWGNTYLLRTGAFTSWFLIDSGSDDRGSMVDVARYVKKQYGAVDHVLSILRSFPIHGPFYINHGRNWLSLSASQMSRLPDMRRHVLTLGPERVAEVCSTVDADYYLPYAHWWGNIGEAPQVDPEYPHQGEPPLLAELGSNLAARGARTRIVDWKIGDFFAARAENRFQLLGWGDPAA